MIARILSLCLCVWLMLPVSAEECIHEFETKTVPAGCTEPGVQYEECVHCGVQLHFGNISALGHEYGSWTAETAADCLHSGTERRSCIRCSHYEQRPTDPLGHDWETEVVPPGCTTKGYTLTSCTRCGESSKSDTTEATGHSYLSSIIAPTCTELGYTQITCEHCGRVSRMWWTNALGHDYADGGDACTRCGRRETESPSGGTQPDRQSGSGQEAQPQQIAAGLFGRGWFCRTDSGVICSVDADDPDLTPVTGGGTACFLWAGGGVRWTGPGRLWLAGQRIGTEVRAWQTSLK